jgi:capsular polysaccharide biosynthesis protein
MSEATQSFLVPGPLADAPMEGAVWREVIPAAPAVWPRPVFICDESRSFPLAETVPAAGVFEASGATVLTPQGWVVTQGGAVLAPCSWYGAAGLSDWSQSEVSAAVQVLDGPCLVLASDWACNNYGHFLFDVAPRIHLVERAGYQLSSFDHVIVPHRMRGQANLLRQAGIRDAQLRWSEEPVAYRCARLVAPSFPGVRRSLPPWAAAFLRERFAPIASGPKRRLYVMRDTTRRVHNEAELINALQGFGFEAYLPGGDARDPRQVFATAEYIVGAHGAGLADIVFSPPGARVLELLPTDHIYPYYFCAAHAAGLAYMAVLCQSDAERGEGAWGPSPHDVTAPIEAISAAVSSTIDA